MMKSFKKIIYATKRPLQCSAEIAEVVCSTSSHASQSDGVYAVCEEQGVVRERESRSLMSNDSQ